MRSIALVVLLGVFLLTLTQTALFGRGEGLMLTHPTLCRGSSKQRTATPYVWGQGPGPAQPQAGGVAALRPQVVLTIASVPAVAQAASSSPRPAKV